MQILFNQKTYLFKNNKKYFLKIRAAHNLKNCIREINKIKFLFQIHKNHISLNNKIKQISNKVLFLNLEKQIIEQQKQKDKIEIQDDKKERFLENIQKNHEKKHKQLTKFQSQRQLQDSKTSEFYKSKQKDFLLKCEKKNLIQQEVLSNFEMQNKMKKTKNELLLEKLYQKRKVTQKSLYSNQRYKQEQCFSLTNRLQNGFCQAIDLVSPYSSENFNERKTKLKNIQQYFQTNPELIIGQNSQSNIKKKM